MDKIKIGFIGAGRLANHVHYPSLTEIKEAEIIAICDINRNRLKETADKYQIEERFTDYKLMLKKVKLDAVYAIMPPISLKPNIDPLPKIVINCLKEGKHVFIEKPPGVTSKETEKMAKVAVENECKTMVAFNRRFIPVMREAKRIVEERGEITHCTATFHKNMLGQPLAWGRIDYLTADVIHAVDLLRWMGGEAEKVISHIGRFHSNHTNSYNALILFKKGCIGHLNSAYSAGGRYHAVEMHARGISAYVNIPQEADGQEALILKDGKSYMEAEKIRNIDLTRSRAFYKCYGFLQESQHFINCIIRDEKPETNFTDALKTMRLLERIKASTINLK